jgi:tellurium resistance protein TerD
LFPIRCKNDIIVFNRVLYLIKIKKGEIQMAITLSKGQKVSLTKGNPGLKHIVVGLGWDTNKYDGGFDFDLDSAAFLLDENGKVNADTDFIFYNNLKHSSGAVEHLGDNLTGEGNGDDEQVKVDLSLVPQNISKIAFTVTIHEALERRQNFGQVSNSYVRVIDEDTNQELLNYELGEDFSIETAIVVCEIYRHNGEWKFNALGSGFEGGLEALCKNFGVNI